MPQLAPMRPSVVVEWKDGRAGRRLDDLAGEEPLELVVGGRTLAVVMRTPGADAELAAGLLFTEGVIECADDLVAVEPGERSGDLSRRNIVEVQLAPGIEPTGNFGRQLSATSACGVCGRASIESVRARAIRSTSSFRVTATTLCAVPDRLLESQLVFAHTGGLHAAALFDQHGVVAVAREDIGRHNAVDKVIGWSLLDGRVDRSAHGLLVSGRGGFEIVQKAVVAGIPLVACVSAPSSLAVQLARESGTTLVGFLRGHRFVIYSAEDRVLCNHQDEPCSKTC